MLSSVSAGPTSALSPVKCGHREGTHPLLGTRQGCSRFWGWLNLKHEPPAVAGTSSWPSTPELQGRVGILNLTSMESLHDTARRPDPSFGLCAHCACALCSSRRPAPLPRTALLSAIHMHFLLPGESLLQRQVQVVSLPGRLPGHS